MNTLIEETKKEQNVTNLFDKGILFKETKAAKKQRLEKAAAIAKEKLANLKI